MSTKAIWPFRHVGLKMWSLVLAVLLWMVVAGEQTVERGLRVPLELQQFPVGLELQGEAPSLIDVRVRGDSSTLSRTAPGDIVAVLDLHGARPGQRLYQITPEQVRVPFGVQVVQVTPPGLALVFEATATRQLPVTPSVEGDPAPGFVVGQVTVSPTKVDVTGPEGAVGRATEALTEPIRVTGARQNVTDSVAIGFQDPVLRLKTTRQATVNVTIVPGPVERALHDLPIHLRNLGANLLSQAVPPTVGLVLRGTRLGLDQVNPNDVTASVDLAGLGVGDYTLPVRVDASQSAGVKQIIPPTVRVKISSAKP